MSASSEISQVSSLGLKEKILDYIEFGSWNHARRCKTDPLRLSKKYHWFLTGCDCGREESAHYEQIKNRQQCSRCVRNKNSTIHVGLNAATWKPPESIETGPENWPRVRYPDA